MKIKTVLSLFAMLSVLNTPIYADESRQIAITIDDLPFVGSGTNTPGNLQRTHERFMNIVNTLVDKKVPATGFIIAGAIAKNEWELLDAFRNSGLSLGNHTYKHRSLNGMSAENYMDDISHADGILSKIMTTPKYFRYPYLAEGNGEKKERVHHFLAEQGYTVAPVTVDSKDYEFNAQFYRIPYRARPQRLASFKKNYLAFIWKQTQRAEKKYTTPEGKPLKQILLIHANLINSLCLGDIIDMYRKNGYEFISLDDAIKANAALNTAAPATEDSQPETSIPLKNES